MEKDRVFREILFSIIPGLGPIYSQRILEGLGGLDKVFGSGYSDLIQLDGIGPKGAEFILKSFTDPKLVRRAREEMIFLDKNRIKTYFFENPDYPYRLRQCPDAPILLYLQGNEVLNHHRMVSVVGSRKASPAGKKITHDFLEDLRNYGIVTLSGLAYGIDIQAHRSSLEFGIPTVGVLGHGLETLYPATHLNTSKEMKKEGALLTEFISGTVLSPGLFPRRNRIIAGLCDALIVVEASEKGGALITAELASSYDREVFAFPGRVNDPYSLGCLGLIRDQKAQLILNADEFCRFMGWKPELLNPKIDSLDKTHLDQASHSLENKIYEFIRLHSKVSLSTLELEFSNIGSQIHEILLNLELEGKLRSLPGKIFEGI